MFKKSFVVILASISVIFACQHIVFSDEEGETQQTAPTQEGEAFQRAVDNVRGKGNRQNSDIFERWGMLIFGDRTPDPLAGSEDAAQTQAINEGVGDRAQTAAQFTEAATSVVTAGTPSPNTASQVGTMVVSEGTSAIVNSQTSPPPAQPSTWDRFVNWVASWFK